MKSMKKTTLKVITSRCILFIVLFNSFTLHAANGEEEGGIGGTGYKNNDGRLLRPDIPGQDMRPEIVDIPERPQRIDSIPERPGALDLSAPENITTMPNKK